MYPLPEPPPSFRQHVHLPIDALHDALHDQHARAYQHLPLGLEDVGPHDMVNSNSRCLRLRLPIASHTSI
jgi:hypothetical protein